MLDLGFVAILAVIGAGLGTWLLARFGAPREYPVDALALALPLGLGTIALAVLGLGEVAMFETRGIVAVLIGGALLSVRPAGRFVVRWVGVFHSGNGRSSPALRAPSPRGRGYLGSTLSLWERAGVRVPSKHETAVDLAFGAALAACLVGTLLCALPPVTEGDALSYHLQVPKLFLERGSVDFLPDLPASVYPMLTEMLYAVALSLRGPVACRLVHWLLGLVFALNVAALARPTLGPRAWWAGTIALLVPAVSNGMSAPLNDVSLAAFGTAAMVAWTRYADCPTTRAAALTGVFTGLALGVKYPALVLAGLIGFAIVVVAPKRAANLMVFVLAACLVGGCWYARAYAHTGNPVYPFFRQVFGGSGLDEVLAPKRRPLPLTVWGFVTALKPLTLEPARFDSFFHQLGPAFLLFLPPILMARPPRRVLAVLAIGYAFLLLCMTQRQSTRFLLIAVGPLSVGVAWVANAWSQRRSWPGRVLVVGLMLVLVAESAWSLARARHGMKVALGVEATDAFLSRREPTYRVGRWIAVNLPENARIVGQDHRGFYLPRDYTMERVHRLRTGLGRSGEDARTVVTHLQRAGFTHLLMCPPVPENAVTFDPALGRLLGPWLEGREPVYRESLADADGVVRHYAIYPLSDDIAARVHEGLPR